MTFGRGVVSSVLAMDLIGCGEEFARKLRDSL